MGGGPKTRSVGVGSAVPRDTVMGWSFWVQLARSGGAWKFCFVELSYFSGGSYGWSVQVLCPLLLTACLSLKLGQWSRGSKRLKQLCLAWWHPQNKNPRVLLPVAQALPFFDLLVPLPEHHPWSSHMPQRLLTEVSRDRRQPGRPGAQEGGLNHMGHLGYSAPIHYILLRPAWTHAALSGVC